MQDLHTKDEFNRQADQKAAERFYGSFNLPRQSLKEFSLLEYERHEAIRTKIDEQTARFGDDVAKAKELIKNPEHYEMHLKPSWANEIDQQVKEQAIHQQAKNEVNRANFIELAGIEGHYEKKFDELLASEDLGHEDIRQKDEVIAQNSIFENFNNRSAGESEHQNHGQER